MRDLKDVLVEIRSSWAEGGAGMDVRAALLRHREREFQILIVFAILMLVSIGLGTWLLATKGVPTAKAFSGVAGLGGGGCLVVLLKALRNWSRTDLLLILIDDASKAQIAALIDRLIKKL